MTTKKIGKKNLDDDLKKIIIKYNIPHFITRPALPLYCPEPVSLRRSFDWFVRAIEASN